MRGRGRERRRGRSSALLNILGIWDGHDAGAALLVAGRLVSAVNEERLSRRKLEIRFPREAIRACLSLARLEASDVDLVAASTSDVAKTLGRWAPSLKESYYRVRRREAPPGWFSDIRRHAKYRITEWRPSALTRWLSLVALRQSLRTVALGEVELQLYDHHQCHAATAAYGSGFPCCVVVTIDGVGDGLSSSVSTLRDGRLNRIAATPARYSPGVFFEHVTNLLNMRELEDEGKVMALADHAAPVADADNPLLHLLSVNGLQFQTRVAGHALRSRLKSAFWHASNEQFAFMAQRAIERACVELVSRSVEETGEHRVALAGGVASNVKANRRIRLLPQVDDVYVFPHMGDGGLALGAALLAAVEDGQEIALDLSDLSLGPEYTADQMRRVLEAAGMPLLEPADLIEAVVQLLLDEKIVLWFQGRLEYGPRALGHRSVLARPDRPLLVDRLNRVLKRRVWYQPFCPSILESDARRVFSDWKGRPNRHMTTAYAVTETERGPLAGVLSVDGSCRPQIIDDDAPGPFADLLRAMKRRLGMGAVLNTSFNLHGEPLVCAPEEAVDTHRRMGADALVIGPYLVSR